MDTIDLGHGLIMTLAQDQISDALSKAQAAVRVAEKNDRNPHLRNQFANLESVIAAGREAMAANGLSLTCHPVSSDGRAGVVYVLAHASGQWRRGELLHRVAANKGLNPAQADGVCVTYARRYCVQSLLAIPTGPSASSAASAAASAGQAQPDTGSGGVSGTQGADDRSDLASVPSIDRTEHRKAQRPRRLRCDQGLASESRPLQALRAHRGTASRSDRLARTRCRRPDRLLSRDRMGGKRRRKGRSRSLTSDTARGNVRHSETFC